MKNLNDERLMELIERNTIYVGSKYTTIDLLYSDIVDDSGYILEKNDICKIRLMLEQLSIKNIIIIGEDSKGSETFRLIEPIDLKLPKPVLYNILSVSIPFDLKTDKLKELEKEYWGEVRQDARYIDVKSNFDDSIKMLIDGRKGFKELFVKGKKKEEEILGKEKQLSAVEKMLEDGDGIIESTIKRSMSKEGDDIIVGSDSNIEFIDDMDDKIRKEQDDSNKSINVIVEKKWFSKIISFINSITGEAIMCFKKDMLLFSFWGDLGEYIRVEIPNEAFVVYKIETGDNDYILINPDISMFAMKIDRMDEFIVISNDFNINQLILASKRSDKKILKKSKVKQIDFDMFDEAMLNKIFDKRSPTITLRFGFNINISEFKDIVSLFGKTKKDDFIYSYIFLVNKVGEDKKVRYLIFSNRSGDEYIIYSKELNEFYYKKYVYRTEEDYENNNLTFVKKINLKEKTLDSVDLLSEEDEGSDKDINIDFVDNIIDEAKEEIVDVDSYTEVFETIDNYRTKNILLINGTVGGIYGYNHIENISNLFGIDDKMTVEFDSWSLTKPQPLIIKINKMVQNSKGEYIDKAIKLLYAIPPIDNKDDPVLFELRERNLR